MPKIAKKANVTRPSEPKKRLRAVLPRTTYQRLLHAAVDGDCAPNDLVVEAIELFLLAREEDPG